MFRIVFLFMHFLSEDYICVHCIYNVIFDFTKAQNLPLQSELNQASPFVIGEARKEFTDKNLYKTILGP